MKRKRRDSDDDFENNGEEKLIIKLQSGMVLIKKFLSEDMQKKFVEIIQKYGDHEKGFYKTFNEKTKNMRMIDFGLKMNGMKHELSIPKEFINASIEACKIAASQYSSLKLLDPNICVVNEYNSKSRLGAHKDVPSIQSPSIPVISFSLGESAVFEWKNSWKHNSKICKVILESGDALIFGGRSRGIIHSVPKIFKNTLPTYLSINDIRYNINLREY